MGDVAALSARLIATLESRDLTVAVSLFLVPLWTFLGDWVHVVNWVVMGLALVLTVYSGIEYLWQAWRTRKRA